jgi:hypothetical protein
MNGQIQSAFFTKFRQDTLDFPQTFYLTAVKILHFKGFQISNFKLRVASLKFLEIGNP